MLIRQELVSRQITEMQRWTIHLDGGPRRVNHAAVLIGCHIYSFGGYCTGENFEIVRPIDVHVLNTGLYMPNIRIFCLLASLETDLNVKNSKNN